MPSYKIKLTNDNGATTGVRTMTVSCTAADRKRAREIALEFASGLNPAAKWRLHDNEARKV